MSRTNCIKCLDCGISLWIGQGESGFYCGMPKVMRALRHFLYKHEGHTLKFGDDNVLVSRDERENGLYFDEEEYCKKYGIGGKK